MKNIENDKMSMKVYPQYGASLEESASSLTCGTGNWHQEGTHSYRGQF